MGIHFCLLFGGASVLLAVGSGAVVDSGGVVLLQGKKRGYLVAAALLAPADGGPAVRAAPTRRAPTA